MTERRHRPCRTIHVVALLFVAVCLPVNPARAQNVSFRVEPSVVSSTTTSRDATGAETETNTTQLQQRYRLGLDQAITPALRLSAGGLFGWDLTTSSLNGVVTDNDARNWSGYARLGFGSDLLGGNVGYDRREEWATTLTGGLRLEAPTLVREAFTAQGVWAPAGYPPLNLQLSRTNTFDKGRTIVDTSTDELQLSTNYAELRDVTVSYAFRFRDSDDRIRDSSFQEIGNDATVTWGSRLSDRATAAASYAFAHRALRTATSAAGATVEEQQFPTSGISGLEAFPTTPDRITLAPNPALIDGDLVSPAGINLGFGPTLAGDTVAREMGVGFPTTTSPVTVLYVWVNRPLPANVSVAYAWTAWQSDDNVTWTSIPLAAPVRFGVLQNRFEIPIPETRARFLKVVTRPLPASFNTDPQFTDVLVTEVQALQVTTAVSTRGAFESTISGIASGNFRYTLLRSDPLLTYDATTYVTHASGGHKTWFLANGLSAQQPITTTLRSTARLQYDASNEGRGSTSALRWSASLSADPIPTAGATFVYSGQRGWTPTGVTLQNSVSLSGRADPYPNVSTFSSITYARVSAESGQETSSTLATVGATTVPHRTLSLTGNYSYTMTDVSGGPTPSRKASASRVEGTGTWSPVASLYMAGTVAWTAAEVGTPSTSANFTVSFSPLRDGALQLRWTHLESIDTGQQQRTRSTGPGLRWNVRRGTFVDASYTWYHTTSPTLTSDSRTFFANLVVPVL